ncbi:MAG: glycerol-3-phosphate dehydrogenase [Vibrio sp.]
MAEMKQTNEVLDIIVVGGGINGAGIALDAAGRGLSVGLYEAKDFASATSSASSKLIHGGLRYLEHYEFRLVSESLAEREVLLKKAPHITKPMRFRLPHRPFLRPAWMIRAGMFLYDHLGKRTTLKGSHGVDFTKTNILKPEMTKGFEYSDCWVDDARLTLLNVLDAQQKGAEVRNYCEVKSAKRVADIWHVTIFDHRSGQTLERKCHALVNAAGPWVRSFITENMQAQSPYGIRLIKGSHIVVPKVHDEPQAYILQNDDQRIVFVIPYMDDFSIIGTTDVEYQGDPRDVKISGEEIDYLIEITNKHFVHQISRQDVVWTYSGVRPLCDDESDSPQAITRDYTLSLEQEGDDAPLLSIFGGKLTTYRKLGEAAMKQLAPFFPQMKDSWTANSTLPGAQNSSLAFDAEKLKSEIKAQCAWLDEKTMNRLIRQFGDLTLALLKGVNSEDQMGEKFADGVYQAEIDYILNAEMALTSDDVLWRRTKLGLLLDEAATQKVTDYIEAQSVKKSQQPEHNVETSAA